MKRVLSCILITMLVLALLPIASAEEAMPDLRTAATQAGDGWSWDQATKTLTLANAKLQAENAAAIWLPAGATVVVDASSAVTAVAKEDGVNADFYAIRCDGDLTLAGDSLLTVESGSGGIHANGSLTVRGALKLTSAIYGIYAAGDLTICAEAQIDCSLNGDPEKLEKTVALLSEKSLTVEGGRVTVMNANGVGGLKGNFVTVKGKAAVQASVVNTVEAALLSEAGIYSINAIAGAGGITLEDQPTVTASVTAHGGAECVMAGSGYNSSLSKGDFTLNGGTLRIMASCTETAAFGLGGIHIYLNGGSADVKVSGSTEADQLSAALVAGKGGGIKFGEKMTVQSPKGGYISHDGRMLVCSDGDAATDVTVSAGEQAVHQAAVSTMKEFQWLIVCLVILAGVAVLVVVQVKRTKK
ncbi:MAG: hypothetical protein IJC46_06925 [Clostridia bacterium]|nr:hypothetical protein [Clostridia bacterium]